MVVRVVRVYVVVLGAGIAGFCPVERDSYLLRVVVGGWRSGVVQDVGIMVRVVVVVMYDVGVDVGICSMCDVYVICGWYVVSVDGGGVVGVVVGVVGIVVHVVVSVFYCL
jgi:hypothetical protein